MLIDLSWCLTLMVSYRRRFRNRGARQRRDKCQRGPLIFAALAHTFATQRETNSNRSSFSSGTSPVRRLKNTLLASSAYVVRSVIALGSNLWNEYVTAGKRATRRCGPQT